MFETKKGFYLTGFNLDIKKDKFQSPFVVKLDNKEEKIEIPNDAISPELLEPLISSKYFKEKDGWHDLNLQHGWQNSNGEYNIVFEKVNFTEMNSSNPNMIRSILTMRNVEFKEYYFLTFDENHKLKSINVCPKDIRKLAEVFFVPKTSFLYNDEMYIVYNEVEKNLNITPLSKFHSYGTTVPILRKFSSDGKIKDIVLNKTKDQYILPNSGSFKKNGTFIFATCDSGIYRSKDLKIGILNFKQ
jgi:hypothetical protein